jgi:hypothetical protein
LWQFFGKNNEWLTIVFREDVKQSDIFGPNRAVGTLRVLQC